MDSLPSSIEAYLEESGFTGTEILVLKRLLEGEAMTLRELAAKTGKSTGMLDQTMKKLLKKNIVVRKMINETPRYILQSLDPIEMWMQRSMEAKQNMIRYKHENFKSYIRTLASDKKRPDIEYFEGIDGIKKAHDKLLEFRMELLTYFDPASIAESDPLSDFLKQFARRRQVHGMFQRIIAPDSAAARRFRSRDPFEYRRTILIRSEDYPATFQKTIAGEVVACMDMKTMEASFLHFSQLADSERNGFERLWREQLDRDRKNPESQSASKADPITQTQRESISLNIPQRISVVFTAFLLLFWSALFLTDTTDGFYNYLYAFFYGVTPLLSGILALISAKKWGRMKTSIGKAVLFVGLGIFLWGFGQMMWSYYNFFLDIPAPYPSLADFAYIPSIFFYSLGVIYLSDAAGAKFGLKNLYAKIFLMTAPIIVLFLSYYFLIVVAREGILVHEGGSTLKTILDIANPLGDFLGLSVAVLISGLSFQYLKGRYALEIWSMIAGIAVMFVADFTFAYTTTVGTYYNGHTGDLIYTVGLFLLSFGVLGFTTDKQLKHGFPTSDPAAGSGSISTIPMRT